MSKKSKLELGAIVRKNGVTFRVWAPFAVGVSVTGSFNNWGQAPMANEGDGYWSTEIRKAEAGQD